MWARVMVVTGMPCMSVCALTVDSGGVTMSDSGLFIEDLPETVAGRPAGTATTQAGRRPRGPITTQALGEEGA